MTTLEVLARPGSHQDKISWDEWRRCWIVACSAPATEGRANEALLQLLADRLEVPRGQVRWARGARSRRKLLEVDRLPRTEIERRLQRRLAPVDSPGSAA